MVLDALCQVARADKAITGQFADRLVPLTMELFKKYSHGEGGRREGEEGRGRGRTGGEGEERSEGGEEGVRRGSGRREGGEEREKRKGER